MVTITKDYKITLTDPEGEILMELSLLNYDLTKAMARASVISDILDALEEAGQLQ